MSGGLCWMTREAWAAEALRVPEERYASWDEHPLFYLAAAAVLTTCAILFLNLVLWVFTWEFAQHGVVEYAAGAAAMVVWAAWRRRRESRGR